MNNVNGTKDGTKDGGFNHPAAGSNPPNRHKSESKRRSKGSKHHREGGREKKDDACPQGQNYYAWGGSQTQQAGAGTSWAEENNFNDQRGMFEPTEDDWQGW